ncbi:catalase [Salipiger sp. PrR003]|uniref:catalase n=1 Tax=Salipiger sp. PrR003 TaxID=2706776 RepID=UPI0013DC07EB|nr:catalase [Salipiger sp. PrR003]NDV49268.1 catalase [Salipiger sp. PrR003]
MPDDRTLYHPTAQTQKTAESDTPPAEAGNGGELHQSNPDAPRMTTAQGSPVSDDQNTLRGGERGPALMEDFHFREKIFHFDHERIPERVVHARGYGAHGYFECTEAIPNLTRASPFQESGKQTPVFVRFSTVAGSKGSFDLARDVRGFAVKMYTDEGNWDLVGNNIPVFFIQDPIKFPDLIHSVKPEPDRGFPQAQSAHDNFWDFISLMPEAMHMIMWIMSDRAIPRSFRFMEGFGVHTFRLINAEGESHFVKFHWKPKLGLQSVVWDEAVKINGADPDFHRRDLWDAIQNGDFPEWELGVQVFDEAFADRFEFDVLDATKLIPEEDCPIRIVGRMMLTRTVDNFFAETEQVAFCTQNIVPGIDFTNDPLLQGRNFSYLDTQTKRLGGPNFTHIPINAPRCPFHHFQQDGHMAMHNPAGRANYEPNSWAQGGPRPDPKGGFSSYPEELGGAKRRLRPESFADHYSQARQFYRSQTTVEQRHIANALTFELSKCVVENIRLRILSHLRLVDEGLARMVADGLGHELPEAATPARAPVDLGGSDKLSILKNGPKSFRGRKLGILVTDGVDRGLLDALKEAVEAEGGMIEIVAPRVGGVITSGGDRVQANQKIDGGPSVLYDAVAIVAGEDGAKYLGTMLPGRQFVADAFGHCKFIAMTTEAAPLFEAAGVNINAEGIMTLDDPQAAAEFVRSCGSLRVWSRMV